MIIHHPAGQPHSSPFQHTTTLADQPAPSPLQHTISADTQPSSKPQHHFTIPFHNLCTLPTSDNTSPLHCYHRPRVRKEAESAVPFLVLSANIEARVKAERNREQAPPILHLHFTPLHDCNIHQLQPKSASCVRAERKGNFSNFLSENLACCEVISELHLNWLRG